MSLVKQIRKRGVLQSARKGGRLLFGMARSRYLRARYPQWRFRTAPHYANPTPRELVAIEADLRQMDVDVQDYAPVVDRFEQFKAEEWFPPRYHGGRSSGVWDEKLLEHWIASELLGLSQFGAEDIYVDIAAGGSPWARSLRARRLFQAFAIDLAPVADAYRDLPYYRQEDATRTHFSDFSVRGASLQCAYEMFMGDADTRLIGELARMLQPGGKVVILPLYMHTHYCAYATREYFGKGYADPAAKEYVRTDDFGVPSSRKYDALTLERRVLLPIREAGMQYRVLALRNKEVFGSDIYCHFILEIEK